MHGEEAFAFRNISRIAFSDSPTHLDKTSGPRTTIIFATLSVAKVVARSVFPQPGGPYKKAPLGALIPILVKLSGLFIAVIRLSYNVLFASSKPPTVSHPVRATST